MTNSHLNVKVNGAPVTLTLPPPTGIRLGRSLTASSLPQLAAELARSYRQQWQAGLRLVPAQKHGDVIAQRLGDAVETYMREPFARALRTAVEAQLAERIRRLEAAPPPTQPEGDSR
jgi:hypothetical protein